MSNNVHSSTTTRTDLQSFRNLENLQNGAPGAADRNTIAKLIGRIVEFVEFLGARAVQVCVL